MISKQTNKRQVLQLLNLFQQESFFVIKLFVIYNVKERKQKKKKKKEKKKKKKKKKKEEKKRSRI